MSENDLLSRLLDAGMTFTALTQARAEELVRDLVRSGAVQAEQAQDRVDDLLARSRKSSERLVESVRAELDEQLGRLDLATRDDLDRLVQRFADVTTSLLRQVVPDSAAPSGRGSSPSDTADRDVTPTGVAAAPTKKAAPAKSSAAKKSAAKKSTAEKSPAKKGTARKSATGKKAPSKKVAAAKKSPPAPAAGSTS